MAETKGSREQPIQERLKECFGRFESFYDSQARVAQEMNVPYPHFYTEGEDAEEVAQWNTQAALVRSPQRGMAMWTYRDKPDDIFFQDVVGGITTSFSLAGVFHRETGSFIVWYSHTRDNREQRWDDDIPEILAMSPEITSTIQIEYEGNENEGLFYYKRMKNQRVEEEYSKEDDEVDVSRDMSMQTDAMIGNIDGFINKWQQSLPKE